jgi:uncharacterized protein (DUF2062 family)
VVFPFLIALAGLGFWLRVQPDAPSIARKMPLVFVVLESWCFFAWFYGDRLRSQNVDALLAKLSSEQADYDQALTICSVSSVIAAIVAGTCAIIAIYGVIVVTKKKRATRSS